MIVIKIKSAEVEDAIELERSEDKVDNYGHSAKHKRTTEYQGVKHEHFRWKIQTPIQYRIKNLSQS
ncbi:MAG: hypothetical protein ACQESW_07700, partial [Bacteroidota bacterium]